MRPAGVATGGFPRPASRTRRALLSAPGSPQVPWAGWGYLMRCSARVWDACSAVEASLSADSGRVEQHHLTLGGPYAVASAQLLPRRAPMLAILPPGDLPPEIGT
jgi:hypothetical protein